MSTDDHDPLSRAQPGEPHFTLMARDPSAADLVRIWVAWRKRDPHLIDAVAKRLKETMLQVPYQPNKDPKHILSAQQVSNDMDLWLREQQRPKEMMDEAETG